MIKYINKHSGEFLVSPALIRNYKAVISISFHMITIFKPKLYEEII